MVNLFRLNDLIKNHCLVSRLYVIMTLKNNLSIYNLNCERNYEIPSDDAGKRSVFNKKDAAVFSPF